MITSKRKPHSNTPGYVCELKAKVGGHVVIYDRKKGASWIDGDHRWIVMHEPSTLHVCVASLAQAREIMKNSARAATRADSFADILPEETVR